MARKRALTAAFAAVTLTTAGLAASPATATAGDAAGWKFGKPSAEAVAKALQRSGAAQRATAAMEPEVVVTHLNNPRQIDFGPGGSLYIAEAGRGGTECTSTPFGELCLGTTGSVAFVGVPSATTGETVPRRLSTGYLSGSGPDGSFALGLTGVSKNDAGFYNVVLNYEAPDLVPDPLPGEQLGKMIKVGWAGRKLQQADIAAVELSENPDGTDVFANPYAVLELPDDRRLVADAGGNTIIAVAPDGSTSVFAVIPGWDGHQAVPTSLARTRDGHIYVGTLPGGEEAPGSARIYELSSTGEILGYTEGFTTITGLDVKSDGTMYVSELFGGPEGIGQVVKVAPDGERTAVPVPLPSGIVVDGHGTAYVAAWSISDEDGFAFGDFQVPPGQIWRMQM